MKTLQQLLVEALEGLGPKDYKEIWSGKKVTLPRYAQKDFTYLMNEILEVHRDKLPTEDEFKNVCQFIADNFKNLITIEMLDDAFMNRFIEVFFTKSLRKAKYCKVLDTEILTTLKGKELTLGNYFFVGKQAIKYGIETGQEQRANLLKDRLIDMCEENGISFEQLPDYGARVDILKKAFN
jgi:hypothetical protein